MATSHKQRLWISHKRSLATPSKCGQSGHRSFTNQPGGPHLELGDTCDVCTPVTWTAAGTEFTVAVAISTMERFPDTRLLKYVFVGKPRSLHLDERARVFLTIDPGKNTFPRIHADRPEDPSPVSRLFRREANVSHRSSAAKTFNKDETSPAGVRLPHPPLTHRKSRSVSK